MSFGFKRADASEIPVIQQIAYDTWPATYEPILGKEQIAYMLETMYSRDALLQQFDDNQYFYFVYHDDEIAGFASFGKKENNTAKLHKIYILPSYQGCGAGKALLQFAIQKIISLGFSQLLLNVNHSNKAISFYEKMGFIITEKADIDIGGGFFMNDYIMILDLKMWEL